MRITPITVAILFFVGMIVGSMIAFHSVVTGLTNDSPVANPLALMHLWFQYIGGWWLWALGGGLVTSLTYVAFRLERNSN